MKLNGCNNAMVEYSLAFVCVGKLRLAKHSCMGMTRSVYCTVHLYTKLQGSRADYRARRQPAMIRAGHASDGGIILILMTVRRRRSYDT